MFRLNARNLTRARARERERESARQPHQQEHGVPSKNGDVEERPLGDGDCVVRNDGGHAEDVEGGLVVDHVDARAVLQVPGTLQIDLDADELAHDRGVKVCRG